MIRRVVLAVMLTSSAVWAQDEERVSITIGTLKVLDLPFVMANYKVSPQDIVHVEALSDKQLQVTGVKQGTCAVVINGNGGQSMRYSVTVLDQVRKLLDRLRLDLDTLPELDLQINQSYIVIRGEVSDVAAWRKLYQVLPLYGDAVQNFATFRPKPESLVNLKKLLADSGFIVANEAVPQEAGKIGFGFSTDAVTLTGRVYTQADIVKLQQVLATQDWLAPVGVEKTDGKIRLVMNLSVEPTMIDVGAVYVGVSSMESSKIGSPNTFNIGGDFSSLVNLIRGGGSTHIANIGAGLNPTMSFLADNGVSRFRSAGHLTFISNDQDETGSGKKKATFHHGGTLSVRVQGTNSGDLKEINYGLDMKVSGGLIGANKVKIDVELERSELPEINNAGDYNQKRSDMKTSFICGLDETVVLAGTKELVENTSGPNGLPYLRKVPVLSWFISEKGESRNDMQLLVLISPRVVTQDVSIKIPVSAETADTLELAETPNKSRMKAEQRKKPWWKRIF